MGVKVQDPPFQGTPAHRGHMKAPLNHSRKVPYVVLLCKTRRISRIPKRVVRSADKAAVHLVQFRSHLKPQSREASPTTCFVL